MNRSAKSGKDSNSLTADKLHRETLILTHAHCVHGTLRQNSVGVRRDDAIVRALQNGTVRYQGAIIGQQYDLNITATGFDLSQHFQSVCSRE